ncbi:MAG TPA: NUDIX domain-containing protein [Vitreimonas sp.]|nr:NUDIX domain-containing protein [Vitreimonas sp.]
MHKGIDYIGVGVGAAIFDDQGRLLLARRGPQAKNERGKWEIPGGAVEWGETLHEAIIRETKEELGITIRVKSLINVWDHILPAEKQHWVSPTFICEIVAGTPEIKEPLKCDELGWFTLDEAQKLPLSQITMDDIKYLREQNVISIT